MSEEQKRFLAVVLLIAFTIIVGVIISWYMRTVIV
jgi:hypothetical protein